VCQPEAFQKFNRRELPGDCSDRSRPTEGQSMRAIDPAVTFVLTLVIGISAGILFERRSATKLQTFIPVVTVVVLVCMGAFFSPRECQRSSN
jgi:hypothetical protein